MIECFHYLQYVSFQNCSLFLRQYEDAMDNKCSYPFKFAGFCVCVMVVRNRNKPVHVTIILLIIKIKINQLI